MTTNFFDMDETFAGLYDEIMTLVDPEVNHLQWLSSIVQPGYTVLDVGAGSGRIVEQIAPLVEKVVAIEPDPVAYQDLKRLNENGPVVTVETDLAAFQKSQPEATFDAAYATYGSLQYVDDYSEFAQNVSLAALLLKSGGRIALEMFAAETYLELTGRMEIPILLSDELWNMEMLTERLTAEQVHVSTTIRHEDGRVGVMSEKIRPVERSEAVSLLESAGFTNISVSAAYENAAYHRIYATKL